MMVSGMTRLRTRYAEGMHGVKVPVTTWTINRQLDGYCAMFAKDLSKEHPKKTFTSAG